MKSKQVFSNLEKAEAKPKKSQPIDIDLGKAARRAVIAGMVTVVTGGSALAALMGANNFFNKNYLEFRSPIVIQAPLLVHQRTVESNPSNTEVFDIKVEAKELEASPSPKPELVLSTRVKNCVDNFPDIADKLQDAFGQDSASAIELVCRESSLNPQAINKSSGAAGLFQAYPASKLGCDLSDVDCQIAWGLDYIKNRYGTARAALLFHDEQKAKCLRNNPNSKKCAGWY